MREVAEATRKRLGGFRGCLEVLVDYQDETVRLSEVYMIGTARLQGAHQLARALEPLLRTPEDGANSVRDLSREKELSELAASEVEHGFRLLHAHFLVGVWGVLESAIDDFVLYWLTAHPDHMSWNPDDEVKVPVAAVFSASPRERAEMFLDSVKKRRGTPLARGINRFEDLLRIVQLDGPFPEGLGTSIFEMQQVRNAYAHCGGIADARFIDACGWLPIREGDAIPMTPAIAMDYYGSVSAYVTLLVKRAWARLGIVHTAENKLYWKRDVTSADVLGQLPFVVSSETPLRRHFAEPAGQESPRDT